MRREERGAVSLMVAALGLTLCIMAALVVDFGLAYSNKSQAQTAADASALAAGKFYAGKTGTCDTLANDAVLQSQALIDVAPIQQQNLAGSTRMPEDLATCEDGTLKIHYGVRYDSPVGLGSFIVGSDHMTVANQAVAALGRTEENVGSLRPWMICGTQIPAQPFENKVVELGFPGNGHKPPAAGCTTDQSGDWWITRCYNGGGSKGDTIQNILAGCESVTLAPLPTPIPTTPPMLGTALARDCNASTTTVPNPKGPWKPSTFCLERDSGGNRKVMADAWSTLLGKTIAMPVFCDVPQCQNPSSLPGKDGAGKVDPKALWPVWKIAAVTVCGFALHGERSSDTLPTGDCNNYNLDHLKPSAYGNGDTGFLLIFKGLLENGQTTLLPPKMDTTVRLVQ